MLGNKPPYTTMQQLNLDWVLSKLKTLLRLVPDDGAVGQILRRTRDGAVWSDEQGGGGAVESVNGQTGVVVLDAADVGALPDDYTPPVTSVNGQTGAVVLGKSNVGLANVDNVRQYSATNPPPYPVTSVNGQTGAVVLDADDVGALPDTTPIPTKTSDLTNDSGFITSAQAPVQSVNGQTGDVSVYVPTFYTIRYTFSNLAQYTDNVYYISIPTALDIAGVPANANVIGMLPEGWSGLGQQFGLARNGSRGIYVLHAPNFNITSSAYIVVYFYYYI